MKIDNRILLFIMSCICGVMNGGPTIYVYNEYKKPIIVNMDGYDIRELSTKNGDYLSYLPKQMKIMEKGGLRYDNGIQTELEKVYNAAKFDQNLKATITILDTNNIFNFKYKTDIQPTSQSRFSLKQYPVYSQQNRDGGGAASCGYHTLLRSIQVVQFKHGGASEDRLMTALMDPAVIAAYFGHSNSDWRSKVIAERRNRVGKTELYQKIITGIMNSFGLLEGDWLDDGEIELLWRHERNKGNSSAIPHGVRCELKTIANSDYIGLEGFDEVTPFVKEQIGIYQQTKQPMFLVFAIGEGMHQIGETGRTSGHWYGLVMQQNSQGDRHYYVMDSMGKDRIGDNNYNKNVVKIINLIESVIAQYR